jgi:hypothetical protein
VDFGGRGVERSQEAVLVAVVEVECLLEFAELLHGEFQDVAGPFPGLLLGVGRDGPEG